MSPVTPADLPWTLERARLEGSEPPAHEAGLTVPGSNIVLDLHGDPLQARLAVFSDGNHHMALEETLTRFLEANPDARDIFYATTPPRIIIDALRNGVLSTGNLGLTVRPHVFISPGDILEALHGEGLIGPHRPFMRSDGLSILIEKGNPKGIEGPPDLLRGGARLAISNPVTEKASFSVYEAALLAFAEEAGRSRDEVREFLLSDAVAKSQIIHHREIPQILASGHAEASLIYHHLALRYTRIFPDRFDLVPVPFAGLDEADELTTTYHVALVGDGGPFGAALVDHLQSDETAAIYESHGLARP